MTAAERYDPVLKHHHHQFKQVETFTGDLRSMHVFIEERLHVLVIESFGEDEGDVTTLLPVKWLEAQRSHHMQETLHIIKGGGTFAHCQLRQALLLEVTKHLQVFL